MTTRSCCAGSATHEVSGAMNATRSGPQSIVRRCNDLFGWTLPSAVLVLLPKCPMCLAAYIAAATGLGVSVSTAAQLRVLLLFLSVAALTLVAAKGLRRFSA